MMEPEDVEWSLNNSLELLGIEYVDCFLVHWPFACEKDEDNDVKEGPDEKVRSTPKFSKHLLIEIW